MTKLSSILDKLDKLTTYISAFILLVMTLWIVTDVLLRAVFHSQITGTIEITGEYLLLIIVYLSLSYTYKEGGHISVDFIIEKFPKIIRMIVRLITNFIAVIIFVLLGYANFQKGIEFYEDNVRTTSLLDYPLAPALMIITLGTFLLIIRLILESVAILRGKFE